MYSLNDLTTNEYGSYSIFKDGHLFGHVKDLEHGRIVVEALNGADCEPDAIIQNSLIVSLDGTQVFDKKGTLLLQGLPEYVKKMVNLANDKEKVKIEYQYGSYSWRLHKGDTVYELHYNGCLRGHAAPDNKGRFNFYTQMTSYSVETINVINKFLTYMNRKKDSRILCAQTNNAMEIK